jgi:hypothetical protein
MKNFYLAPLLLLFVGTGAQSQVVQESELELYDQSADGQPATCGVQFTFAFRDDVYGTILPGGTTGSISHMCIRFTITWNETIVCSSSVRRGLLLSV